MNHPDSNSRAEADRWLTAAAKLLATRDFQGTKTFAIRARDTDPSGSIHEAVDRILAVADTLILSSGDPSGVDYYSVLQLPQLTQSLELIATHFRRLALLLNPERNPFPFAEHAFRIVSDAWSVLSNPTKKVLYDNELRMSLLGHGPPGNFATPAPPAVPRAPAPASSSVARPMFMNGVEISIGNSQSNSGGSRQTRAQTSQNTPVTPARPVTANPPAKASRGSAGTAPREKSFWTCCPYCFHMYEYAKMYEDCVLKCQNCERAFHGVVIEPPPVVEKDSYYSCWGHFPIGFPGVKNDGRSGKGWMPITAMVEGGDLFPGLVAGKKRRGRPPGKSTGPKVYYHEDEINVELSDESDDSDVDWRNPGTGRKTRKARKGKSPGSKSGDMVIKRPVGRPRKVRDTDNPNTGGEGTANFETTGSNGMRNQGTVSGSANVGEISRGESSKKAVGNPAQKRAGRGTKELGKLDLNVEFSNDQVEEPMRNAAVGSSKGAGHGLEDTIEGSGFFEGLDEFLSSLPILSVVGDDKVKAA
ncbi:hypothetical protein MLD38_013448 [Melastoma candidum]|uniref:Uncharacterized protein n=1 Tax=Melastoma candidum TaxID=119954 RepID=A0ACB9R9K9_9MYRT|nr:hypothetical protein MLD38_013448 [Melastoma candidum]